MPAVYKIQKFCIVVRLLIIGLLSAILVRESALGYVYRVDSYQNMSLEFVKYIFCFIKDIVDSIMKGNHKTIVRNVLSSSDLLLINYQIN